jgi:hypothetical protein
MYNAQICQDIFVNKILNKNNGYFVDIGAGTGGIKNEDVGFYSNTYFFEHKGWTGIAIDCDNEYVNRVKNKRNCKVICADLEKENINKILEQNECPNLIDYLSIDVDDIQYKVFNDFDFNKYKFKVLTLEHCLRCSNEYKIKILQEYDFYRKKLTSLGYKILWGNVHLDRYGPVEDWYVDEELYEKFKHIQKDGINCLESFNI